MDSFPLDDFAIYVEPAESEDTSEISNASAAANVKTDDNSPVNFPGELVLGSIQAVRTTALRYIAT